VDGAQDPIINTERSPHLAGVAELLTGAALPLLRTGNKGTIVSARVWKSLEGQAGWAVG